MADDSELLLRYTRDSSDAAFAELVRRYLNLVYFAALRQVGGDAHLAQDVSQTVFSQLALKAPQLLSRVSLAGWLYTCAGFVGARARRGEQRRLRRQADALILMEANMAPPSDPACTPDSAALEPMIDSALRTLSDRDRELILLRYFRERSFPEISAQLGLSPDAARFRIERAFAKMRTSLARRGVASTPAALALVLVNQASATIPSAVVAQLSAEAIAATSVSASFGPLAQFLMSTTQLKISIAAAVALVGALLVLDVAQEMRLRHLRLEMQGVQADHRRLLSDTTSPNVTRGSQAAAQLAAMKSKLKARAIAVRSAGAPVLKPGMTPVKSLANVGQLTPFSTLETVLWARSHGEVDALSKMIKLMPDAQVEAERLWAGLPLEIQKQFSTPESLVALSLARYFPADWAGYQVTGDQQNGPTPDYWLVRYEYQTAAGASIPSAQAVQQINGDWMILVGPKLVQHFAAEVTGSGLKGK